MCYDLVHQELNPLEDKKTAMYAVEPPRQTSSSQGLQLENNVSTDQEERAGPTTVCHCYPDEVNQSPQSLGPCSWRSDCLSAEHFGVVCGVQIPDLLNSNSIFGLSPYTDRKTAETDSM